MSALPPKADIGKGRVLVSSCNPDGKGRGASGDPADGALGQLPACPGRETLRHGRGRRIGHTREGWFSVSIPPPTLFRTYSPAGAGSPHNRVLPSLATLCGAAARLVRSIPTQRIAPARTDHHYLHLS